MVLSDYDRLVRRLRDNIRDAYQQDHLAFEIETNRQQRLIFASKQLKDGYSLSLTLTSED